jgi:23S rRNA (cytidine1920-2'-O)/16S rRNA (cytidine1409-2'-O)-methyltransferase
MKERADKLVVDQGLARSRQRAQALIMAGSVYVREIRVDKPGQLLQADEELSLKQGIPYVSRGGLKLEAGLRHFEISVQDKIALDLGASTGGFTDCLLQRGARRVYALDVDPRQLDWRLQNDPRVTSLKKNARYLVSDDLPEPVDLVTMDLSFISLLKVLPALSGLLKTGPVIALLKPQFEAGRDMVGKKGVIRDPQVHLHVLQQVLSGAEELGFGVSKLMPSPIRGQKGNREFLILLRSGPSLLSPEQKAAQIKEAVNEKND